MGHFPINRRVFEPFQQYWSFKQIQGSAVVFVTQRSDSAVLLSIWLALHKFRGAAAIFRLERPVKVGVIPESTGLADICRPHSGAQHLLGNEQPFQRNVTVDADSHNPGKFVG